MMILVAFSVKLRVLVYDLCLGRFGDANLTFSCDQTVVRNPPRVSGSYCKHPPLVIRVINTGGWTDWGIGSTQARPGRLRHN